MTFKFLMVAFLLNFRFSLTSVNLTFIFKSYMCFFFEDIAMTEQYQNRLSQTTDHRSLPVSNKKKKPC